MWYDSDRSGAILFWKGGKMELSNQIRKYRKQLSLSQEELGEKVFVTRQTISNWENEKSYPDINSLLLLSSVFGISLDQLIKGDIEIMKEEINKEEVKKYNRLANIFSVLLVVSLIVFVPLIKLMGLYGFIVWVPLYAVTMIYSVKVSRIQKANNVSTYKEIVAFSEGKKLDEIQKQREIGKRPYQNVLKFLIGALIAGIVFFILEWIF